MRIFNIIQCANLGGMEKANLELLSGLKARGHEIELLSLNPIAGLKPLLEERAIPARGAGLSRPCRLAKPTAAQALSGEGAR